MKITKYLFLFSLTLTMISCASARPAGDHYFGSYSEAEKLFKQGEYERAIQKYQEYRDENPEGNMAVISQYYIAKSHAMLGHVDTAKDMFQDIIAKHPDLVWANFSQTQLKELESTVSAV